MHWQPISGQDVDNLIADVAAVAAFYAQGYQICMAMEMPHPDWSQAPPWATWWAVDPDGYYHWFDNEPILTEVTSQRELIGPHWSHHGRKQVLYDAINIPLGVDWRLLKEPRKVEYK